MVKIMLTLPNPLDAKSVHIITTALQRIDDETILVRRDPANNVFFYQSPVQEQPDLEAFGTLFLQWLDDPAPTILGYSMVDSNENLWAWE